MKVKNKHFIFIIQNNNNNRKHIKIKNKKDKSFQKKLKHEPSLKKPGDFTVPEGHGYSLYIIFQVSVRPVVLLGGQGQHALHKRVSKEESLESAQILHKYQRFQNLFFFSSKCGDFKTLFFPLLEMWRFCFFLEIFQNAHFTMYVFMGDFSRDFRDKK